LEKNGFFRKKTYTPGFYWLFRVFHFLLLIFSGFYDMIHILKKHSNIQGRIYLIKKLIYNEKSQKKEKKPISGWFFHVCFLEPTLVLPTK